MAESTEHIRSEIKRAFDELREDFEFTDRSIDRNLAIIDRKVDIAMWAIHAVLRLLDEQKQCSASGSQS